MSPSDSLNLKPAQLHALQALIEAVEDDRGGIVEATHEPVTTTPSDDLCCCDEPEPVILSGSADAHCHQCGRDYRPDDAPHMTKVPTVSVLLPSGLAHRSQAPTFRAAAGACLAWLSDTASPGGDTSAASAPTI